MFSPLLLLLPFLSTLAFASPTPITTRSGAGSRIRSISNPNLCVTVQNGFAGRNSRVALSSCWSDQETFANLQRWSVISEQNSQIDLIFHTDLCLDSDNGENGTELKVSECNGVEGQVWNVEKNDDGYFKFVSQGKCMDVEKDSTQSYNKPYVSDKDLQIWDCHDSDHPDFAQQLFELV